MSNWPATKARRVLAALQRIGWVVKRQSGFGSFGLFNQLRELSRALASRHWPTGEAVILSAAVHERRGSRGRTLFEPVVQFRYTRHGADVVGFRLAFGDVTSRTRPEAEQVVSAGSPAEAPGPSVFANDVPSSQSFMPAPLATSGLRSASSLDIQLCRSPSLSTRTTRYDVLQPTSVSRMSPERR